MRRIVILGWFLMAAANAWAADATVQAVGALGAIEPRSRVVRVSHNAGAEGVNLLQLRVQEGTVVKQGEVLAILADHEKKQADVEAAQANIAALQARLAAERVNLSFVEKEYQRYQSLAPNALASKSLIESKELAFKQAQAVVQQLKAEIAAAQANQKVVAATLNNTHILAPMDGTILKVHARPGERLGDAGLLEMADLTQLDMVAEVFEADLPRVKVGQQAEVRLNGNDASYHAEVRELGFLVRKNDLNDTDPLADRDNRVIAVRLTLEPKAVAELKHQIYSQAQVRINP